jgi:drug/metabolite transporter (DMT)-like permease
VERAVIPNERPVVPPISLSIHAQPDRGAFWQGVALGSLCSLIWGIQAVVSRQSVHDGLAASDVTVLRFLTAGLILLPIALRQSPLLVGPLGWRRAFALTCVAGAPYGIVLVGGAAFAPAIHSAVIGPGLIPLIASLLGFLVGERPGPVRLLSLALILVGICVFSLDSIAGAAAREGAWRGDLLFGLTAAMWASFGFLTKLWRVPPIEGTASICVLSLLSLPFWAPFSYHRLAQASTPAIALQAIYQGVLVGVVSLLLYNRCVALLGPVRASLFVTLIPIVAAVGAVIFLGEQPSVQELAGMMVVLIGMGLALRST